MKSTALSLSYFHEVRAAIAGLELVATTESGRAERSIIAIPHDRAVNAALESAISDVILMGTFTF